VLYCLLAGLWYANCRSFGSRNRKALLAGLLDYLCSLAAQQEIAVIEGLGQRGFDWLLFISFRFVSVLHSVPFSFSGPESDRRETTLMLPGAHVANAQKGLPESLRLWL